MMEERTPLDIVCSHADGFPSVFLGGSIEMGKASFWQDAVVKRLQKDRKREGLIFNPRRPDWDSSWKQEIDNPNFSEQVMWEIRAIDTANVVAFYFDPNTKSPITLFELGYVSGVDITPIVCCAKPYWKKGNVDVYGHLFHYIQAPTFNKFVTLIDLELRRLTRYVHRSTRHVNT